MDENFNVAVLTFIGILIFTGVSIALYVAYRVLNKYSNFGDSSCNINEYTRKGISYERCRDEVTPNMKFTLFDKNTIFYIIKILNYIYRALFFVSTLYFFFKFF